MVIRMTSARQAILDELENNQAHLTTAEIHDRLQERLPSINLSTVYRSLEYLVENRLVTVSDIGIGSPVYECLNEDIHHHLVCLNCQGIIHLEHALVAPFFEQIEAQKEVHVLTNHMVLFGRCSHCA